MKDSNDSIINKVKTAKTDAKLIPSNIEELENRPEAENLIGIYSNLKKQNMEVTLKEFGGKNFSEFKNNLSEQLIDKISPIAGEINKLLNNSDYLDKILLTGAEKANEIAEKKVKEIKKIVGF